MTIAHCHWLMLESIILMLIDSVGTDADWCWLMLIDSVGTDADWCWLILINSSILNICTTAQANTAACKWTSLLPGSWSYHIWSSSSSLLPTSSSRHCNVPSSSSVIRIIVSWWSGSSPSTSSASTFRAAWSSSSPGSPSGSTSTQYLSNQQLCQTFEHLLCIMYIKKGGCRNI